MAKKPGPHATLCKNAVTWLTMQGAYVWVNNTGNLPDKTGRRVRFGLKGSADIIGVMPDGRFIGAEAKIKPDVLSPDQVDWAARVVERGGVALVFYDLYELEDWYAEALENGQ